MHQSGLLLSIVVFVAVYSTVYCAPYPGDDEDLANRPFHLLQKRPTAVTRTSTPKPKRKPTGGKNKVTSPRPTNLGLNNRVSSSSNTRFSSSSSLNRGSSNFDLSTYKNVCKSCPSSANACEIVGKSKGKQLYTTTKCMNGSRVISEKTKTSPNPSGAMVKTRQFASHSSSSSG
ncbi:uncharacterized protein LOC123292082 [Chrysoperla carnea]|uniref:uncharacterized protein LOC123292082 n=1 Tax=Chrysoperla carnea TaxID=189513 RepID=UPI001D06858E|nr:uncharacterized protein LOC123292082 [Chrysoperla carnea]